MNPVVQELRRKMHHTTMPSLANRAADEIERLEQQRDELLAVLAALVGVAEVVIPKGYTMRKAIAAIAKARGQA